MDRLAAVAWILCLIWPRLAGAQATLREGFGGMVGYGTQCLGPNDDGHSPEIDLTPVFPEGLRFFDRVHTSMYVNTNGNITFTDPLPDYTPESFPVAARPMIAPYWADVDLREAGCTSATQGNSGEATPCLDPTTNGVWWHLDPEARQVIVTWHEVGYYACRTDKTMSFQLILTAVDGDEMACGGEAEGSDFDVEFRFASCEWNTGEASAGAEGLSIPCFLDTCVLVPGAGCIDGNCATAAQSGFDAGNSRDFVEIRGSRGPSIHTTLCSESNVDMPGVWRFQIRSGAVVCPGAGEPCDTGTPGVCASGRTQCVGDGIECRAEVSASEERCDALDNDCDGSVDEDSAEEGGLCAEGEICDRGVCQAVCFEGGCPEDLVCNDSGRCVDAGCETQTCPDGQRCIDGDCTGACDGVACPAGLSCRGGSCVDLCAGSACDDCTVCEEGACVPRCAFEPCPEGETCLADGRCVEEACATLTCPAGEVCAEGACRDACADAVCPQGEICRLGACEAAPPVPMPDAGPPAAFDAAVALDAGAAQGPDATAEVDAGRAVPRRDSGCGCRVDAKTDTPWAALALCALALFRRRRR